MVAHGSTGAGAVAVQLIAVFVPGRVTLLPLNSW